MSDIHRKKLEARLTKLPANSGHAINIRRRLGLGEFAPKAPAPVVEEKKEVVKPAPKKKVSRKKKKEDE